MRINILFFIRVESLIHLQTCWLQTLFAYPSCVHVQIVTLWYRAPEILLSSKCYSAAVDIWSLGCVFAEMITQKPLFCADTEICLLFEIFGVLGTPTTEVGCIALYCFKTFKATWKFVFLWFSLVYILKCDTALRCCEALLE